MNNKKNFKPTSFFSSVKNAMKGIIYFYSTERNGKIQLAVTILVLILSSVCRVKFIEWIIVLLLCVLVMVAEMFNTAIERMADRVNADYDIQIKWVKDIAAGAVLLLSIVAVIIGAMIFLPRIFYLIIFTL